MSDTGRYLLVGYLPSAARVKPATVLSQHTTRRAAERRRGLVLPHLKRYALIRVEVIGERRAMPRGRSARRKG